MNNKKNTLQAAICFAVAGIIIASCFPTEGHFKFQFFEGKPWKYELLTAPKDFPIYKTEHEIETEKDSIQQSFVPYFQLNTNVKIRQIDKLKNDNPHFSNIHSKDYPYLQYIEKQLDKLYDDGILPALPLEDLKKEGHTQVYVIKNNVAELKNTDDLHSVGFAYDLIFAELPPTLDVFTLNSYHVGSYLASNMTEDKSMSERILDEQLSNVALSTGMVQAGERIVDRGEVVDHQTFNILRSLRIIHENRTVGDQQHNVILAGQFILILGFILCCAWYFASFCPEIFYNRRNVIFVLLCILSFCLLSEICVKYQLFNIYILPFAIVPIVTRTFFNSHAALFTHLATVILCSLVAPFPHEFLLLQTIAGIVVIFSLREISQRSHLIRGSVIVFLAYAFAYLALVLCQEGDFYKINWMMILFFGINFILLLFSYTLIYMLEKLFGYLSPITLVELSNINTPLLKQLSENCPGTFQHSLNVSILASEAAAKTGADSQLIRTGALYHDVGKMLHPVFFTENQKGGANPHQDLPFEQSAQIIINHVKAGVKLAEKASLPKPIIDFIRTHHGKSKTRYFYNSFRNTYPDAPVDETLFTYPGPNPSTKETAILMMADSVEAASRSLKTYTDETLGGLFDKIVNAQINEGLFRESPLTFKDIEIIKAVFVDKLKIMYHTRISYPELIASPLPETVHN